MGIIAVPLPTAIHREEKLNKCCVVQSQSGGLNLFSNRNCGSF